MIINRSKFTKEGLGDLAISRDDNFTRLRVHNVERDFLSKEDVRKLLSKLVSELIFLLLVVVVDLFELLLELSGIPFDFLAASHSVGGNADILNDSGAPGRNTQ